MQRLGNGTGNLKSVQRLWQSHDLSIDTKVRLLKTIVWSAATYGWEGWMLKKSDELRIEAFEMKVLRQILRVSWTARKTNEWILEKNWSNKNFVSKYKDNKVTLFWTHHETQLYWKGYQPRNLIRKEEKRKPKDNMVRQHHSVDRYGLGKNTESNGQQKSMEKDDPWCGRIGDRGWLKSSQVSQCKQT